MAMKKVSAKEVSKEAPKVEEKAPEVVETVDDGASNAPSEPEPKVEEPPKEEEKPEEPVKVAVKATDVVAGADGKVPCKALRTCFVGGMVRYEGQTFRQFVELAQTQADRGDLEILG